MRYIRYIKNILINIALFVCALTVAICGAEYVLRKIVFEELSGHKIYLGERGNSAYYRLLEQVVATKCKDFKFTAGNCYPSDPTGSLPLKVINPDDGNYYYCVAYNKRQRRQGYNPNRQRQIALVGDSFTFGEGVKETDTLGYLLNKTYPQINFQNWGKSGANLDGVALKCIEIVKSSAAIDEVVYFYNLNDIRMSKIMRIKQSQIIFDFQTIHWINDKDPHGTFEKLLLRSALFSSIRKVWILKRASFDSIQNYKDMYLSEYNRKDFLATMNNIMTIKKYLAAHGISFRMIIYPLLYKDVFGCYPFERIHEEIMSECYKRGVTCLDGYVPFKNYYSLKRFAVHPLDYHPNGLSNRELVNYIHEKNFITNQQ